MRDLKRTLDAKGHALLEMPSGTGKTISLLSLILAYQRDCQKKTGVVRQLIYCSRTVPEIEKALAELQRLVDYRRRCLGKAEDDGFLALGLTSRKNLCINPQVAKEKRGRVVDAKCRQLTAPWVRDSAKTEAKQRGEGTKLIDTSVPLCKFYEDLEDLPTGKDIPSGVYTLEQLKEYGVKRGICPYYLARRAMKRASVIIYSFHYLLDPKIAELISKDLSRDAIIVFDEAHNIDNVCIESMSIDLTRGMLDAGFRALDSLADKLVLYVHVVLWTYLCFYG